MSDKSFAFKRPVQSAAVDDSWVETRTKPVAAPEPAKLYKVTAKVPEDLKRRIKSQCASRGEYIEDVLLRLLEKEFPPA